MTDEEIMQRVREILRKGEVGSDLTSREEAILAYAYYAAGAQAMRMQGYKSADFTEHLNSGSALC